jgi:hypothetical protein
MSTEKSWVWWLTSIIPATEGSLKYEDHGPGWPVSRARPCLQINQRKWNGGMTQVVQNLPHKCEALKKQNHPLEDS